jgi:hypothetical protein
VVVHDYSVLPRAYLELCVEQSSKVGCSFSSRLVGLSQVVADIHVNVDYDVGRT